MSASYVAIPVALHDRYPRPCQLADATGKVPLVWALAYLFLSAVGYLYFAPVAVAVFSRTAPASINAVMIGFYYLSIFSGSIISGRLGGLLSSVLAHPCSDRGRPAD
jgi:dipeptide/tripeptide permease